MITHRSLGWDGSGAQQGWVSSLVSLRQSQGLRTAVVDIEDVFDEFGYGLVTPQAVKDFITYAYESWQSPAPQYVLLVGDTSYDYKDNWASGTVNLVPGYLIYTTHLGETITDEWLVQVSGADAVPDLYIGRLPAATLAQAQAMVNKIVAYETAANTKGWEKTLVLAADNQAEEWEAVFETMNEDAAALLPAGMATPERFYLQEYENEALAVTDLTADLLAAIEAGALVVNYSGHGSVNIWATERIIDNRGGAYRSDVVDSDQLRQVPVRGEHELPDGLLHLSADGRLCGRLLAVARRGLAVAGERRGGGGPDADGDDGHRGPAPACPTRSTRRSSRWTAGAGAGGGLRAASSCWPTGVRSTSRSSNTFMFFGDPATSLKVPLPRRPQALTAVRQADGTVALSWAAALDCDGNAVAGYNLYRRLSTEETYTKLNAALIAALTHTDTGLAAAAAGATYYYALSAVDSSSDESVKSAPAALTIAASGGGGGGVEAVAWWWGCRDRWRRGRCRVLYRCGGLGALAGSAHAACGHGAADLSILDRLAKERVKGARLFSYRLNGWFGPGTLPPYAACNRNSTFTASKGKTICPSSVRSRTPALSNAVTSPWTALTSRPTRRAASRIDTGPAPQRALSSSHRFWVNTRQSNSGVAKLMRADFRGLPAFQARAKSAIESAGVCTSKVTVFMVPPRDVILEVSDQLLRCREHVGAFLSTEMPVIALPDFVVVAQNAFSTYDVRQSVLEPVQRPFERLWKTPQYQLRERRLRVGDACACADRRGLLQRRECQVRPGGRHHQRCSIFIFRWRWRVLYRFCRPLPQATYTDFATREIVARWPIVAASLASQVSSGAGRLSARATKAAS